MTTRFAAPMAQLIDEFRKLPGVGTKTAQRFAFHVLRASEGDAEALAAAIRVLKQQLRLCSQCNNITDVDPCSYCTSPARNAREICIVEEPTNIAAIEKTRSYNGLYHVLHGTLSPVNSVGPESYGWRICGRVSMASRSSSSQRRRRWKVKQRHATSPMSCIGSNRSCA